MCKRCGQFGFTLMEVLLSLSILSIILVVILGALRIGVRAWEKGENVLSVQQRARTILDQLSRQLECNRPNAPLSSMLHEQRFDQLGSPAAKRLDGRRARHIVGDCLEDRLQ